MNRPPFPDLIDNTIRSEFRMCHKKAEWAFIRNIAPATPNIHLHAGGALAAGLQAARVAFYEEHQSEAEARRRGLEALIRFYGPIELPPARSGDKSLDNVVRAFDSYFERYPLSRDAIRPYTLPNGKAMVEFTFALPTELTHPTTGNPILYGGRCDMIAVTADSGIFVEDEKTTSSLGEQWSRNWILDSQITGYIAGARHYGFNVAGAIVRGIGLLKTKITHAEVTVLRSQWEIDRWWNQLHRDIKEMIRCWEEGYWDYALDKSACNAYGGCQFEQLCTSPQPEQWIPIHFRPRNWNPLEKDFGERLLEHPELLKQVAEPELQI